MRRFVCKVCGAVVETLGRSARHECQGKWRDLEEVPPNTPQPG